MRTWKIQAETEAGIKHYEITAASQQAALRKAMRDILTLGKATTLNMEWEVCGGRRKMTEAEKLTRKIEKAQRKLAEMGGADVNTPDSR